MKRALKLLLLVLVFSEGHASALLTFAEPEKSDFACVRDLIPITEVAAKQIKRKGRLQPPFVMGPRFIVFLEQQGGYTEGVYVFSADKAWHFDSIEDLHSGETLALAEASRNGIFETHKIIAQPDGLETIDMRLSPQEKLSDKPLARLKTRHSTEASQLNAVLHSERELRESWIRNHNLDSASFKVLNGLLKTSCAPTK